MKEVEQYFYRLSPKNRLLIWLLASGYSAGALSRLKVRDLCNLMESVPTKFPDIRAWCEDQCSEQPHDAFAFEKQQGIPMPKNYIIGLLIKAHGRLGVEFTSLQDFVDRMGIATEV